MRRLGKRSVLAIWAVSLALGIGAVIFVAARLTSPDAETERSVEGLSSDSIEAHPRARDLIEKIEGSAQGSLGLYGGSEGRNGLYQGLGVPKLGRIQWTFSSEDTIFGCPTAAGDDIYFGNAPRSLQIGGSYNFYCLDRATGRERWKVANDVPFFTSPAVSQDYVCICGGSSAFLFVRRSGEKQWEFPTEGSTLSSPVISRGMALFGSRDGHAYAIDLITGKERWKFKTSGPVYNALAIEDGRAFVSSEDKNLYAVDLLSGKELWREPAGGWHRAPVVAGGRVYIGGCDRRLEAFSADKGSPLWTFEEEKSSPVPDDWVISAPAVDKDRVYVVSRGKAVYALDTLTGKPIWKFGHGGWAGQPPTIAQGVLYFLSKSGNLTALDAETGKLLWKMSVGQADRGPVISGDMLVVANCYGRTVYAIW